MQTTVIQQALFADKGIENSQSWFSEVLNTLGLAETPGWPDQLGNILVEWNRNANTNPPKVLSLFSGAGGLDIGFHDAGFQIVECNEIEKDFTATLLENSKKRKHLCGSNIVCMDINYYDPQIDKIDFIIGGPPCQTFSAASARAAGVNGLDDDRGNLFKQYVRILEKLQPRGFLFENVYRIVGAQGGKPWEQIQKAFTEVGYNLFWRILDAADFGVPQFRERLIIVGLKEGKYQFPCPTHGPDSPDRRHYYTSRLAIAGVTSKVPGATIGGRHGHLLNDIPPGLNYSFYTEQMRHPTPFFGWRSKFSDYLYKADPETPVRTIKAQGGQYTGPFHWENRTFTIEELKRLQTFPDDYTIIGNRQKIIHQLGNSVPPQLARILALSILQQVFGILLPFNIRLLSDSHELGFRTRKSRLTKTYKKKAADAISNIVDAHMLQITKIKTGNVHKILTKDLRLLTSKETTLWDYRLEHNFCGTALYLKLWDRTKKDKIQYEYSIHFNISALASAGINLITMQSYSDEPRSVTTIWKYLEIVIREHVHKDDLVQLFGYYQYRRNYSIAIECKNSRHANVPFWKILSSVSQGHCVGKLIATDEMAGEFGVKKVELISELKKLKSLGFEIRSHNTNRQINKDYLLIPYSFPSLNERSLQRLTEL